MSRKDQKLIAERLGNVSLFSGLSAKELAMIVSLCDEVNVEAGTAFIREGTHSDECYVIVSGEAVVSIDGEPVAAVRAGDSVGELAPLDHHPRSATVTALTDVHALVFGRRELASALLNVPNLSQNLLANLAGRLRAANSAVASGTVSVG